MGRGLTIGALALLTVSGCTTSDANEVNLSELEHIHSVLTDGEKFFLASHHGLYVWSNDSWQLQGEEFDIMGLALDDGVFYASGHPGPSQDLPDPLGVLISRDDAVTWEPHVLTGEVDFHLLEVVADTMVGVAANYGQVVASADFGQTWSAVEISALTSLSMNPSNGNEILLASDGALLLSSDAGTSFNPVDAPDGVVLVAWSEPTIYLATDSALYQAPNLNGGFSLLAEGFSGIQSIDARGYLVIVLDEAGVHVSRDGGKSFSRSG